MTAIHCPPRVTGTVDTIALLANPSHNTLGAMDIDHSIILWSGCLDATDHLHSGSHVNLKSNFDPGYLVYAQFRFRPF